VAKLSQDVSARKLIHIPANDKKWKPIRKTLFETFKGAGQSNSKATVGQLITFGESDGSAALFEMLKKTISVCELQMVAKKK